MTGCSAASGRGRCSGRWTGGCSGDGNAWHVRLLAQSSLSLAHRPWLDGDATCFPGSFVPGGPTLTLVTTDCQPSCLTHPPLENRGNGASCPGLPMGSFPQDPGRVLGARLVFVSCPRAQHEAPGGFSSGRSGLQLLVSGDLQVQSKHSACETSRSRLFSSPMGFPNARGEASITLGAMRGPGLCFPLPPQLHHKLCAAGLRLREAQLPASTRHKACSGRTTGSTVCHPVKQPFAF